MILAYLQASAVFLFLLFVSFFIGMFKVSNIRVESDEPEQISSAEQGSQIEENSGGISSPTHSFEKWTELMYNELANIRAILKSERWDRHSLNAFKTLCSDNSIKIVHADDPDWLEQRQPVHFDDPAFLPLLWENGYNVLRVQGRSLSDILKEVPPFSLILISVKDDGSQALNHKWQEQLWEFGIRSLTRDHLRHSYINLIRKTNEGVYVSLSEELSADALSKHYRPGDTINDYKMPIDLKIFSAGSSCGNLSSIIINGQEYSMNLRGFNIVIYDLIDYKVRSVHRVDSFVTVYEDSAIYHALPEVETNEL